MEYRKRGTAAGTWTDPGETARLLKILHIRMEEMIDSSMKEYELTASQCNVLGYILEHEDKKPAWIGIQNRFSELQTRIYRGISDEELRQMTVLLTKMLGNLREDREENEIW